MSKYFKRKQLKRLAPRIADAVIREAKARFDRAVPLNQALIIELLAKGFTPSMVASITGLAESELKVYLDRVRPGLVEWFKREESK